MRYVIALAALASALAAAPAAFALGAADVKVWTSRPGDPAALLSEGRASESSEAASVATRFSLDPSLRRQVMEGFGASLTESAAYVISSMPEPGRDALMRELFDPSEGLGLSLLRQPMGASDFALGIYSYDDLPSGEADPRMERFSIERDRRYVLPLVKRALALNSRLKVIASPWSPPAWMKTGKSMLGATGGVLKPELYGAYADYFVRFIRAYEAEGIPIAAVTPQNEMNYAPASYPGMAWSAAEEGRFVREALGPAFEAQGIRAKILCYDHNWDRPEFAIAMLSDPATARYLAGSAWHYYGGAAGTMERIGRRFPDKEIWFTEGGSGRWIGEDSFELQFKDGIAQAIGIANNGAKSIIWWNLALDRKNGPVVFPNSDNYGLVEVDGASGAVSSPRRACYYTLAHFSRFVRPGAVRIEAKGDNGDMLATAFRNDDGSLVIVLANPYAGERRARVFAGGLSFDVGVPGDGAATCVFRP